MLSIRSKIITFIVLMQALTAAISFAAPALTGISGTVTNGSTIIVTGTGFGNGYNIPLLWDNFDTGSTGTILSDSPQMGSWLKSSTPSPIYSSIHSHSGTMASYAAYDNANQWSQFVVNPLPLADKFYQSFWFLYNTTGTNGQLKLVQVHGNSGMGDFAPGIMTGSSTVTWWFSYISTESGINNLTTRVNYPSAVSPNVWHRFEMVLKRSSGGNVSDGTVIIKIDNEIVYNKTNIVTRENSAYNWNEISFFHGVTNMGGNTNVYVDDAYLSDSWSRVIVADSPIYNSISHSEIQVASLWSDTSITITLNKGSFVNLNNVYLYVIDVNGNVNAAGFPLCPSCPRPPSNLTVQ